MTAAARPSRGRLVLFAFGDFGFNLYWQSVMLFLLFYYTDTLGFDIGTAATTYMVASIWDGLIGFVIGLAADRSGRAKDYRRALTWGALPLGFAFILAYLPVRAAGAWSLAILFAAHLVFRTFYALVNVPYLAMTARISAHPADRSLVAGLRMIFGTLAAVLVSLGTVPIGRMLLGSGGDAYLGSACLFAALATIILILVGRTYRDADIVRPSTAVPLRELMSSLIRNRAYLALSAAMVAMVIAATMVGKSVLYYFKYFIHDEQGGQLALAGMMATGLAAIPVWMFAGQRLGVRRVWIIAVIGCVALLGVFALFDLQHAGAMQMFLVALQAFVIGLNYALWALLPEAVDLGEAQTGRRVEATVFGLASLLQRIAIGLATAMLGWGFQHAGFKANSALPADTLTQIRTLISAGPILFFALSGLAIALAPELLGRAASNENGDVVDAAVL